jgi:hypothetical protein
VSAEERLFAAAVEMIRAADFLRLLQQIARARGEPPEVWIGDNELNAVRYARDILDHHGYFRVTSARR